MTKLLEKAIDELKRLPADEQDQVAREIMGMLESEKRWDALFSDDRSEKRLGELAARVRDQVARGDVVDGDPSDRQ